MNEKILALSKILRLLEESKDIVRFKTEISSFYGSENEELQTALIKASEGDNRELNHWFFNLPSSYSEVVPWLGKVKTDDGKKFTWLVGLVDNFGQGKIRDLLNNAWEDIRSDELFCNPSKRPPFISYMKSIISSEWQANQTIPSEQENAPQFGRVGMFVESTALPHNRPLTPDNHVGVVMSSDIEIFQDNFEGNEITEDIDWKMPLSSDFLENKTLEIFERVKALCSNSTIKFYEKNVLPNIELITKLHTEIHNYGHFVGPSVYSQEEKNVESYEAIEEFRACATTGAIVKHLDVDEDIYYGLPVHVFFMRYLGYGYDSFLKDKFDVVNIREMEVGALFYHTLGVGKAVRVKGNKLDLTTKLFPSIFQNAVKEIHKLEFEKKHEGKEGLKNIAKLYRERIYSNSKYTIKDFYKSLNKLSTIPNL